MKDLKDYAGRLVLSGFIGAALTMLLIGLLLASCSKPRHYNPRLDGYSPGQELGGYSSCKKCGI